jgi:hypothetical protein
MPTATYIPLATFTVGTSATSVTFSNIPGIASYRDLVLVSDTVASGNAGYYIQFNGDTGNNYSYLYALGDSSSVLSDVQPNIDSVRMGNTSTARGTHRLNIMDYSATDKHKTVLVRSDISNATGTWMFTNRWASTAAVTSFRIFILSNTLSSGTTFSLYGIKG